MSSSSIMAMRSSSVSSSILATSWEVRNPSKKWMNGILDRRVAAWATAARSWASWTDPEQSRAQPVCRTDMMSEWSQKMESAWVARVRAATCMAKGVSSPAIL